MSTVRRAAERLLWWIVGAYLLAAMVALLVALWQLLKACFRRRPFPEDSATAGTVPEFAFREADPLIYSQSWLQSQGLAVTWQNPDIHLELASAPGVAVDSHALTPDTPYRVFAQIWNASTTGPAADVEVRLSYIDFGIGGTPVPIAVDKVDVPVKGAVGSPAIAQVDWRTPAAPGHYCLQAQIVWPYDANPGNNLGQHNTDVKPLNSPTARFTIPVRNVRRRETTILLTTDAYLLAPPEPCPREQHDPERHRRRTRARHNRDQHPVPEGWTVQIEGADDGTVRLDPGQVRDVEVTLIAPDGFKGRQVVNVHGIDGGRLVGGVTLIAEGDADA